MYFFELDCHCSQSHFQSKRSKYIFLFVPSAIWVLAMPMVISGNLYSISYKYVPIPGERRLWSWLDITVLMPRHLHAG